MKILRRQGPDFKVKISWSKFYIVRIRVTRFQISSYFYGTIYRSRARIKTKISFQGGAYLRGVFSYRTKSV